MDSTRDDRELVVDIWYPVDPQHAYGPMSEYDLSVIWPTLFVPSTRAYDAPPISQGGPFPLVVYSHGSGSFRFNAKFLTEELASHGYLVLAPGHTGNTPRDEVEGIRDPDSQVLHDRPQDITFLISWILEKNADPADPFGGRVDPERIGVCGASYGGFTTMAVAGGYKDLAPDLRVRAIVPISPAAFDLTKDDFSSIRVPTLILTGTEDFFVGLSGYSFRRVDPVAKYLASFLGAWHGLWGIKCEVQRYMIDNGFPQEAVDAYLDFFGGEVCAHDLLSEAECQQLTELLVVAFFDAFLEHDSGCVADFEGLGMAQGPCLDEFLTGCRPDCNGNAVPDDEDIRNGSSADVDGNGIPDECEASVLYVKGDCLGQRHGTSWTDAYTDIQDALRVAAADCSESVKEIWVAAGTYTPDGGRGARSRSYFLGDRVAMYGGFAGVETSREQRDWARNRTILSADLAGDDQPSFTNREDNSISLVKGFVLSQHSVLDGFTIEGAYADRRILTMQGGAVSLINGSLTVENCRFTSNMGARGGAMLIAGPGTVVRNCEFFDNRARFRGGAVGNGHYLKRSSPKILSCTFSGNVADVGGGALWSGDGSAILRDCILWGDSPDEISNTAKVRYCDVQGGYAGNGNIGSDPLFVDSAHGDLRIRSGSRCIDRGSAGSKPAGLDLHGSPRFLDGDLDGVMRVDMGAHEFDNVRLEVSGNATPGGSLTVDASGTGGLPSLLVVGTARTETLLPPFGGCFVDLSCPWMPFTLGTIPASRTLQVPSNWPTGLHLVLQAAALAPPYGNFSNPVFLGIE